MFQQESANDSLGREKTQRLVLNLLKIADEYACISYEILEDIGESLGICYYCKGIAQDFREGVCLPCYERDFVE